MIRILANTAIDAGKAGYDQALKLVKGTIYAPGGKSKAYMGKASEFLGKEGREVTKQASSNAKAAKDVLDAGITNATEAYKDLDSRTIKSSLGSSEGMQSLRDKGMTQDEVSGLSSAYKRSMASDQAVQDRISGSIANPIKAMGSYATGDGSLLTGAARVGTVAVGARIIGGGSLTRNNRGERDIVGVPFV